MNGEDCLRQAYEAIFRGDFESAIRWFGQAIELEPDNAEYRYRGSITCARSGKLQQALSYAERAVELNPEDDSYRMNLRTVQSRERIFRAKQALRKEPPDSETGAALLVEAAKLDPLSAEAKLLLGIVCRSKGEFGRALALLRDAVLLEPGLEEAKRLIREIRSERRLLLKMQVRKARFSAPRRLDEDEDR